MNTKNIIFLLLFLCASYFDICPMSDHVESYHQKVNLEYELNNIDRLQKEIEQLKLESRRLDQLRLPSRKKCSCKFNKGVFIKNLRTVTLIFASSLIISYIF